MTTEELVRALRDAVLGAEEGNKVVAIHLFGIRYAAALDGRNLTELAAGAGLEKSWVTEIRKGVRLAEYVTLKGA